MTKFNVRFNRILNLTVQVEANGVDEAERKAEDRLSSIPMSGWEEDDTEITEVELEEDEDEDEDLEEDSDE
jgi:hypothetical protein